MAQFISSEIRTNLSSTCSEIKQTKEKDKELYTTFPTINFTPRFSRKVNIAKKIVRKFKKYLKSRQSSIKYPFWINFTKENYLPPFKYEEQEFKSFSHSFLRWLFSHDGGIELYQDYITEKGESELTNIFKEYNITDVTLQKDFEKYFKEFSFIFSERKSFNCEYIQRKIEAILEIDNIEDNKGRDELFSNDLFDKVSKEMKIKRKKSFDRSRDESDSNWLMSKSDSSSSSDNENENDNNNPPFLFEE